MGKKRRINDATDAHGIGRASSACACGASWSLGFVGIGNGGLVVIDTTGRGFDMRSGWIGGVVGLGVMLGMGAGGRGAAMTQGKAGEAFFEERITPVLKNECFPCHHAKDFVSSYKGGLLLDSLEGMLKGGDWASRRSCRGTEEGDADAGDVYPETGREDEEGQHAAEVGEGSVRWGKVAGEGDWGF